MFKRSSPSSTSTATLSRGGGVRHGVVNETALDWRRESCCCHCWVDTTGHASSDAGVCNVDAACRSAVLVAACRRLQICLRGQHGWLLLLSSVKSSCPPGNKRCKGMLAEWTQRLGRQCIGRRTACGWDNWLIFVPLERKSTHNAQVGLEAAGQPCQRDSNEAQSCKHCEDACVHTAGQHQGMHAPQSVEGKQFWPEKYDTWVEQLKAKWAHTCRLVLEGPKAMTTGHSVLCRQPLQPPAACASPRIATRDSKKVEAGPHVVVAPATATKAAPCRKATALAALKSTQRSPSLKTLPLPPAAAVCSPRGSLPGALHACRWQWVHLEGAFAGYPRYCGLLSARCPRASWANCCRPKRLFTSTAQVCQVPSLHVGVRSSGWLHIQVCSLLHAAAAAQVAVYMGR